MKTLIAEDDLSCRLVLERLLQPYGECTLCANGREAVNLFVGALGDGRRYDLVCLDIMMPDTDGQTALRLIRKAEADRGIQGKDGVRVIMTTGVDDRTNILGAFREQCDGYLLKPVSREELISNLAALGLIG